MSLPHEVDVSAEIAKKSRVQIKNMTELHNAVVGMMTAGSWTITKKRGLSPDVARTMMGLLTKVCKTFRSIQILCERGLHEDANTLVRVLMETTVTILFILQKRSRERMLMYHAHGIAQGLKMMDQWKQTPGLKRGARKALFKRMTDTFDDSVKRLPPGTDVKRHWSGKSNLYDAMRTIHRGRVLYGIVYRPTSSFAHGSDFGAHVTPHDGSLDNAVYEIEPRVQGFDLVSYTARQLLWLSANRIDERLGLGFAGRLAPHKLTRAQLNARQI